MGSANDNVKFFRCMPEAEVSNTVLVGAVRREFVHFPTRCKEDFSESTLALLLKQLFERRHLITEHHLWDDLLGDGCVICDACASDSLDTFLHIMGAILSTPASREVFELNAYSFSMDENTWNSLLQQYETAEPTKRIIFAQISSILPSSYQVAPPEGGYAGFESEKGESIFQSLFTNQKKAFKKRDAGTEEKIANLEKKYLRNGEETLKWMDELSCPLSRSLVEVHGERVYADVTSELRSFLLKCMKGQCILEMEEVLRVLRTNIIQIELLSCILSELMKEENSHSKSSSIAECPSRVEVQHNFIDAYLCTEVDQKLAIIYILECIHDRGTEAVTALRTRVESARTHLPETFRSGEEVCVRKQNLQNICDSLAECINCAEVLVQNTLPNSTEQRDMKFHYEASKKAVDILCSLATMKVQAAVHGVVKSGKSTFVNCITGDSLCPSRIAPMTVLPTRFVHRPGLSEPHMILPMAAELNRFVQGFRVRLQEYDRSPKGPYQHMDTDDHGIGPDLVSLVRSGKLEFHSRYLSINQIRLVLHYSNEIFRVVSAFNKATEYRETAEDETQNPLYRLRDDYPLVELNMAIWKPICKDARCDCCGLSEIELPITFEIVDTPGVNESRRNFECSSRFPEISYLLAQHIGYNIVIGTEGSTQQTAFHEHILTNAIFPTRASELLRSNPALNTGPKVLLWIVNVPDGNDNELDADVLSKFKDDVDMCIASHINAIPSHDDVTRMLRDKHNMILEVEASRARMYQSAAGFRRMMKLKSETLNVPSQQDIESRKINLSLITKQVQRIASRSGSIGPLAQNPSWTDIKKLLSEADVLPAKDMVRTACTNLIENSRFCTVFETLYYLGVMHQVPLQVAEIKAKCNDWVRRYGSDAVGGCSPTTSAKVTVDVLQKNVSNAKKERAMFTGEVLAADISESQLLQRWSEFRKAFSGTKKSAVDEIIRHMQDFVDVNVPDEYMADDILTGLNDAKQHAQLLVVKHAVESFRMAFAPTLKAFSDDLGSSDGHLCDGAKQDDAYLAQLDKSVTGLMTNATGGHISEEFGQFYRRWYPKPNASGSKDSLLEDISRESYWENLTGEMYSAMQQILYTASANVMKTAIADGEARLAQLSIRPTLTEVPWLPKIQDALQRLNRLCMQRRQSWKLR